MSRTIEEIKADIKKSNEMELYTLDECLEYANEIPKLWLEYYIKVCDNIPLDELEQICQARREDRLVVLPCKVGDALYIIENPLSANPIIETTCIEFSPGFIITSNIEHPIRLLQEFGLTIFLTKPEAEKALQELKEGDK